MIIWTEHKEAHCLLISENLGAMCYDCFLLFVMYFLYKQAAPPSTQSR